MGSICHALNDISGAIGHLEQSLSQTDRLLGQDHPLVARRAGNLGILYQTHGDLKKAEAVLARAAAVAKQHNDPYEKTATKSLDLVRKEIRGEVSVNRSGTTSKPAGKVLRRGEVVEVESIGARRGVGVGPLLDARRGRAFERTASRFDIRATASSK
mmetsp:Transcript_19995/g.59567  ORF Transcript_19995/g.59567 Transcript_19995/m.59567 type:complete len:157 (+) Transcript_19995:351-821(+)